MAMAESAQAEQTRHVRLGGWRVECGVVMAAPIAHPIRALAVTAAVAAMVVAEPAAIK